MAFGFANLAMLPWLAAAAVPLVIHLWNRRRYREVQWAAVEYLLAALQNNARRLRVEQWLLLAVRMLIIILVAAAMAEPFLQRAGARGAAGARTMKVIVIDGSFSMAFRESDVSRFDRAKQLARQVVEQSAQGDGFALVLMTAPATAIVSSPSLEAQSFLSEIDEVQLEHGGGDLAGAMGHAIRILEQSAAAGFSRSEVYFISDMGRTSWGAVEQGRAQAVAQQRVARLAQLASLIVLDVGQSEAPNLAVTELRSSEPKPLASRPLTLVARVRSFGVSAPKRVPIELWVDGHRTAQQQVDVPRAGAAAATFTHRFEDAAEHTVDVRLAADGLEVDNHRYLALSVKEKLQVLVIDGKPGVGGPASASYFLNLALNPNNSGQSSIQVEVAAEGALIERSLNSYDCIFLSNVAQFTASEAHLLESYLKRGGGLVFFLGDQVIAERYNAELGGDGALRVLPARIGPTVGEAKYFFDPLDYRHPLVSVFKGRAQAGLLTTPVYRYFRLEVPKNSQAKVALAFEGGDPAIVEERIARGRSIVLATDGSLSSSDPTTGGPWTNMPAWPSYVPLVQELLALATSQATTQNVEVGQTLSGWVSQAVAGPLKIETPQGKDESLRIGRRDGLEAWAFSDTRISGIYTLRGSSADAATRFAVNVDSRESDLARTSAESLPNVFATAAPEQHDTLAEISPGRTRTLHKILLTAALALLFFELLLTWRFGREAYERRPAKLA